MGRLFGTDGVRGVANAELSPELALSLGRAGAYVIAKRKGGPARIVVGKDTRISSDMLEAALISGITSAGCHAQSVGVIPTPGVAFLVGELGADAGVVISASHNPMEYNGIKFFGRDGFKLSDDDEDEIEALLSDNIPRPTGSGVGRVENVGDAGERYVRHLISLVPLSLAGFRIVLDTANGAASWVAPEVLRRLGAEVIPLNDRPDGVNINAECGSTHPDSLRRAVLESRAHIGFAHDGDADRVIAIDEKGNIVNGDHIMGICGLARLRKGLLPGRAIVATAYSNLGLIKAFERNGASVVITSRAGDRYVLEEMLRRGLVLGGEQSGHVIFLDKTTTGDGILTALELLSVMLASTKPISELAAEIETYPQVLMNVEVKNKEGFRENVRVKAAISEAEDKLKGTGRIFVRASGTEPLIRVLGEGPVREEVEDIVKQVALVIREELG